MRLSYTGGPDVSELEIPTAVAALAIVSTIAFFILLIWSMKRHRDPRLEVDCDAPIEALIPSIAGLTLGTVVGGNSVEVLENRAFFDALIDEIHAARRSVHFETFLWKEGAVGSRLAEAFIERARAGVTVRILLDANGTRRMGRSVEKRLQEAGCRLRKFHTLRLANLGVLNERDHRKLAILDGRVAFIGGHCIVDDWSKEPGIEGHVADVSLRLRGPIVHSIQSAFSENWVGRTGELFMGDDVFPPLDSAGGVAVHAAFVKPEGSAPAVKILHHAAICCAKERIWIQNPYFLPEPDAIDAFGDAVKRGVDVRVLMPSTSGSDNPMVQHAGHRNFEKLLRCGVRLIEYPSALLHQKVMTIDGKWCAVGSANFDDRSFETNDEITVAFIDVGAAKCLDDIFERYAADGSEIELERWIRRSPTHKFVDQLYYLFNELL
jgi:cardiolipin synthase